MALAKKAAPYDLDVARDMQCAQEEFGAGIGKQIGDFLALRLAGASISFEEYLYFGLYARPRAEQASYMGDHRARAAFYLANDLSDWYSAEDKLSFHEYVVGAGLPTPRLAAVAHEERAADRAAHLKSADDVREFLGACALPIFGKPARASHGDGAVQFVRREGGALVTDAGKRCAVEEAASEIDAFAQEDGYLFQEALKPHPVISTMTKGRVATLRLLVWLDDDGPSVREAVLRLPAGDNKVDNFRREGNLVAYVDQETGALGAARRGVGVRMETFRAHPDTGAAIEGATVPDFTQAKSVVEKAAALFPSLRLQSWDAALTDAGTKLLEVNPGGNFNIIQLARGRGAFDPEFRAFLARCLARNPSGRGNAKALKEAKKLLKLK